MPAALHAGMHLTGQTPVAGIPHPEARHNIFTFAVHHTADGWLRVSDTAVVPNPEIDVVGEKGEVRPAND